MDITLLFLLLTIIVGNATLTTSTPPDIIDEFESVIGTEISGSLYIAAMVPIRHPVVIQNNSTASHTAVSLTQGQCPDDPYGDTYIADQDGLQVIAAIHFGIKKLNTLLGIPQLGAFIIDTCHSADFTMAQSKHFLQTRIINKNDYECKCGNNVTVEPTPKSYRQAFSTTFAVLGAGNSDISMMASSYLKLVNLPLLSYFSTSLELSNPTRYPGFFRTIPSDKYAMKALAKLIERYKWHQILVVSDTSEYSKKLITQFKTNMANPNLIKKQQEICLTRSDVLIKKEVSFNDLKEAVDEIIKLTANNTKWGQVKVVLTLLSQPIAENLIHYIEQHPDERLGRLIWIGTDAWIGRHYNWITPNNNMLQNCIGILPSTREVPGFWKFYTTLIPSEQTKNQNMNPWLARRFELVCSCQYKMNNKQNFWFNLMVLQLAKIRIDDARLRDCLLIEKECSRKAFDSSRLMLYIHYVVDAVLAYGYAISEINNESNCRLNVDCLRDYFSKLNFEKLKQIFSRLTFEDSTGEQFTFWKGREGKPDYSIMLSQPGNQNKEWSEFMRIFQEEPDENNGTMKIQVINATLDEELMNMEDGRFATEPCNQPCRAGYASELEPDQDSPSECCRKCKQCSSYSVLITNRVRDEKIRKGSLTQICYECKKGDEPNPKWNSLPLANQTKENACQQIKLQMNGYGRLPALSIVLVNMVGLICSIIIFVVLVSYWKTAIVRASNPLLSMILLAGTTLSFACSISILDTPNPANCILRWVAPGFCSTMCYGALLTKTNTIARVFAMKPSSSSKRGGIPLFTGCISQLNFVIVFMIIECIILLVITITKSPTSTIIETRTTRMMDCTPIDTSTLLATFFLPILLLVAATVYAFKTRKLPNGYNETRNINFLNFANCIIFFCCLLLYHIVPSTESYLPLCLLLTLGAIGNLCGLFAPKVYTILCRPDKNTAQDVWSKRSESIASESKYPISQRGHSPNMFSESYRSIDVGSVKCRSCQKLIKNEDISTSDDGKRKDTNASKVTFMLENIRKNTDDSNIQVHINQTFDEAL